MVKMKRVLFIMMLIFIIQRRSKEYKIDGLRANLIFYYKINVINMAKRYIYILCNKGLLWSG